MRRISTGLKMAAIAFAIVLAGCETKPPPAQPAEAPASVAAPVSSIIPGSAEDLRVNVGDTVHFDYNKYAILDVDKATLQRQATWLARYPSVRVNIEGNCDERGTREYNLALAPVAPMP